ncbi:MAG: preprotein translocase subunit SecE [Candidatus Omnitrophica bacterium]|nr:preprotein translocase subunit SecE [Candidatus Omnitrophota bacterium]MDD5574237.1 preprotein translocase subunit SecE [Candidatus Omnitrophota bacterium]
MMVNVFGFFAKIPVFFREVKAEMLKVAWPSRQDLIGATWIVLIVTTILTAYIGALDFVLSKTVSIILQ